MIFGGKMSRYPLIRELLRLRRGSPMAGTRIRFDRSVITAHPTSDSPFPIPILVKITIGRISSCVKAMDLRFGMR